MYTPEQPVSNSKGKSYLPVLIAIFFFVFGFHDLLHAQSKTNQITNDQIVIGKDGVMRWSADGKEVTGFGVNYTVPFAYAYRAGKKMGVDLKAAIDQDVYQFSRLGLDLFRVHVWDCEISDTLGNLLQNEHLDLFDYLLFKLQQKGINAIITPIAYWGNGWPEKDEPTPGFSTKYGKGECLTNEAAIKAQENYLNQFVRHVNPYNNGAYKDDPMILAFEVSNEPHHHGTPEEVEKFVRRMKKVIRSTGCTKPVFYNVSHSVHLAEAYFAAGIDGGTFQWYPTGLGFQKELGGNMLPNVDKYTIPFDDVLKKNNAARIVYEFDAADMASTYMYPAMARSFRSAGIQLATHFSYDPTFLAPYNTEYNTHYMNLMFAPQKALSLMLCAEVFRTIPLHSNHGVYPANSTFGPFRVSYEQNLAEMVTPDKFIYTNNTSTKISSPEKLQLIAGYGKSQLIESEGTGAYFLDKLGEGIWRLELMPNATIIDNLFGRNNLDKTVAVVNYERSKMKFNLPEFEDGYAVESVDWRDSIIYREVFDQPVELKPGIYLVMSKAYEEKDTVQLRSKRKFDWDEIRPLPVGTTKAVVSYNPARKRNEGKNILPADPISLFDAALDVDWLNRRWVRESGLVQDESSGQSSLHIKLTGLTSVDEENKKAPLIGDYTMRHYFGDLIADRKKDLPQKTILVFEGHTVGDTSFPVQLSLIMKNGSAYGGIIELNSATKKYSLKVSDLKKVTPVLLPRPYPTFLPYYSSAEKSDRFDITQIESLQISIGPGIKQKDWEKSYDLMISGVRLE